MQNVHLETTVVFIDYECWRYGVLNESGGETDFHYWFEDLKHRGRIKDIFVFGDFTNEVMAKDKAKIRTVTSNIIDCSSVGNKKDYTDFIILDCMYQKLIKEPDVKQFVLFSGDSHFHSVIAFLKNFNDKTVGVYAVKGTLSSQIKSMADWYCEIVAEVDKESDLQNALLNSIRKAEMRPNIVPTFTGTVMSASYAFPDKKSQLSAVLKRLIDDGYITQAEQTTNDNKVVRGLITDWSMLQKHGIWTPTVG